MRFFRIFLRVLPASLAAAAYSAASAISQYDLTVGGGNASASPDTGVTFKDTILPHVQSFAFTVVGVVAVGVFVWIGYRLVSAHGNEEEFKKAWVSLTYAVVGLALIPAAYAIVRIVSGLTVN
jgi:hypothetical protein